MSVKSKKEKDSFVFWMPCELEKAKGKDGKKQMRLKGIASTTERDSDGEILDPNGFDLDFFLKGGMVNWHHQTKTSPLANIGEPEVAKIVPEGLYVECLLYEKSKLANEVYELAELLEESSKTRRLGFSIEGKVLERDPLDETKVMKAKLTGLAVTHIPKNPATLCEIMKGERDGFDMEWEEDEEEEDKEKALDSVSGAALKTESLEGSPDRGKKKQTSNTHLTKAEVFEKIFAACPDIAISKSKRIYQIIEKTSENMNNGQKNAITDEAIEKAFDLLGLGGSAEQSSSDELEKAAPPAAGGNGGGRTENPRTRGGETTFYLETEKAGEYHKMYKGESEDGSDDKRADENIYIKKGDEFVVKGEDEAEKAEETTIEKGEETTTEDKPADEVEKGQENEIKPQTASPIGVEQIQSIVKGEINGFAQSNNELIKALGTIMQGVFQNQNAILERMEELERTPAAGRKSIENVRQIERFAKGEETGAIGGGGAKQLSASENRAEVLRVLNAVTFEKGELDQEMAKGLTLYEASGELPQVIRQRVLEKAKIAIVD